MYRSASKLIIVTVLGFALTTDKARAQVFAEDFEGDLSAWAGQNGGAHSGAIVHDPVRSDNRVVTFTQAASGGDIFSAEITPRRWPILISFEYRGAVDSGFGYLGRAYGLTHSTVEWLAGPDPLPPPWVQLPDDGLWDKYYILLNYDPQFETFRLVLEDHGGGTADAWFDNLAVHEGVRFVDDFEGDLSQWVGQSGGAHSGETVVDPAGSPNQVLTFSEVASGGDVFSVEITPAHWPVVLSFRYRGGAENGGFGYAGWSYGLTRDTVEWLAGPDPLPPPWMQLPNDDQWGTYEVLLTYDPLYETFRVVLEDHGHPTGDAWFDDVVVYELALPGDMNCDGRLNGADIDPFFLALGDPVGYAKRYHWCDVANGDMNEDGFVNGADIDPFFQCLGGGNCP